MEEFEHSSDAGNRKWKSSSKVQGLESEMNEFESNSDSWNRERKFELGIGNVGVQTKFVALLKFSHSRFQASVRVKFRCLESGMEVRGLESGM